MVRGEFGQDAGVTPLAINVPKHDLSIFVHIFSYIFQDLRKLYDFISYMKI